MLWRVKACRLQSRPPRLKVALEVIVALLLSPRSDIRVSKKSGSKGSVRGLEANKTSLELVTIIIMQRY